MKPLNETIRFYLGIVCLWAVCTPLLSNASPRHGLPEQCWGVYGRGAKWDPAKVNRQTAPLIKGVNLAVDWQDLEPEPGHFMFERIFGERLRAALENNYHVYVVIYFSPAFPDWLEAEGVRLMHTEPGMGGHFSAHPTVWPCYLEERYKHFYYRVLRETGDYFRSLPPELSNRILFIECTEGSTGDPGPYKQKPLDPKDTITDEQWLEFRLAAWEVYREAFQGNGLDIPLLFKTNRKTADREIEYMFRRFDIFGLKQGQGSHGYNMNGTQPDLARWRQINKRALRAGKTVFSRGEMDSIWFKCGWAKKNQPQFLYWAAIFAAHYGIDLWDMRHDACLSGKADAGIQFHNKYANERHNPATARHAFCAFRRGLDSSDTETFPEETYGKADAKNVQRYLNIVQKFRAFGAIQSDPKQGASSSRMVSRRRKDYNDVGWETERGNYWRFLEQIDPEKTSVAYWHKGPEGSLEGRFARGFDIQAGKSAMFFRFTDAFLSGDPAGKMLLSVVYLDEGNGSWRLDYTSRSGIKTAMQCTNTGSDGWKRKTVEVNDARFAHRGPRGSDLILSGSGADTVFHLIEVEKGHQNEQNRKR